METETVVQPMSSEAIALAEKKLSMTLDEIIKMSKRESAQFKKSRASIKRQRALNNAAQRKSSKSREYMDLRSVLRQGALARKRSSLQGNHFQLASEAVRKVAVAPFRGRAFKHHTRAKSYKSRSGAQVGQGAASGGITAKLEMLQLQGINAFPTSRPKTLDSLFSDLKEQRMKALSGQKNNSFRGSSNSGSRRMPPWRRARFDH